MGREMAIVLFLAAILVETLAGEVRPASDYTFNGEDQYLTFVGTLPTMTHVTVCNYVTTNDKGLVSGPLGSYTNSNFKKALIATGEKWRGGKGFRIHVNGQVRKLDAPFAANTEYHFCIVVDTTISRLETFINGKHGRFVKYKKMSSIAGGGEIVIGTSHPEKTSRFTGRLRNFMIWNRALTPTEIDRIYNLDECPGGNVVNLLPKYVIPHGGIFKQSACPSSDLEFENIGEHKEYVEVLGTLPDLEYVTICLWVTTDATGTIPGTIGSYVVNGQIDTILAEGVFALGVPSIRIAVNGQAELFSSPLMPNTRYHVCIAIYIAQNKVITFVNGHKVRTLTYSDLGGKVDGGGKVIAGQRQIPAGDHLHFDEDRAYNGKMSNFIIWGRILSEDEISAIATSDICPDNYIMHISKENSIVHSHKPCVPTDYSFDNSLGRTEYLDVIKTLPDLEHLTICVIITTDEMGGIPGTVGSYAVESSVRSLVASGISGPDGQSLRVVVNGKEKTISIQLMPKTKYVFCLTYNLPKNTVITYVNGIFGTKIEFDNLGKVVGGGKLIIGQEQGCVGGCFSSSFTGRMQNFHIWDHILTIEDILELVEENECPTDAIVTLEPGNVVHHAYNTCKDPKFSFDNSGDREDYVVVSTTLPDLDYLTICDTVTTNQIGMLPGTIGSYATDGQIQSIVATGELGPYGPSLRVTVNGQDVVIPAQFMPNQLYKFCLAFHLPENKVITYINGFFGTQMNYTNVGSIVGGGTIVIGQKQGCVGGCFDHSVAFNGEMQNFRIYDRILTQADMLMKCPVGAIVILNEHTAEHHVHQPCIESGTYTLDNSGSNLQYIEILQTLPQLQDFTICSSLTVNQIGMIPGTIGSYAVAGQSSAIVASGEIGPSGPALRVTVNGQSAVIPAQFLPNTNYDFCLAFTLSQNMVKTYINGFFGTQLNYTNMGTIQGGGTIVIGQKQGCVGGCFVKSEAYNGKISFFMIWEEILDSDDYKLISVESECPADHIIDLAPGNINVVNS